MIMHRQKVRLRADTCQREAAYCKFAGPKGYICNDDCVLERAQARSAAAAKAYENIEFERCMW